MPLDLEQPESQRAPRTAGAVLNLQGICTSADGEAARTLLARLEYTRVQRRVRGLSVRTESSFILPWFSYEIAGIRTGLHEGVLLGAGSDDMPLDTLQDIVADTGATMFKLTRTAPVTASPSDAAPQTLRTRHWTIVRRPTRARELLRLTASYDDMLAGLGRHTRRNIRAARKRAAADGLRFDVSADAALISPASRSTLARRTEPCGMPLPLVLGLEAYADRTGRPFRAALRGPDGAVVSYVCGYFGDPAVAYLLYQLNDPAANHLSPSLLHRSFLIEWLVQLSCPELVFVHGCSGILFHACVRQPLEDLFLVRRSPTACARAAAIGMLKPESSLGRLARLALTKPQDL
ncbi:MAG: hypothetical protein NVS2B11_01680 [Acetobacteraceae bacterium]